MAVLVVLGQVGCEPSFEPPSQGAGPGKDVRVHGAPLVGGVSRVVRFEVPDVEPGDLRLFAGSLSEYYERRLRERDLPESLLERQVPALAWDAVLPASDPSAGWIGSNEALIDGQRYSLGALGQGLLLEVDVALEQPSFARRVWPPAEGFGRLAVFCSGSVAAESRVSLDGCAAHGRVTAGIGDSGLLAESCFTLALEGSVTEPCLAPLSIAGVWLPATRLEGTADPEPQSVSCADDERPLADGCSRIGDSYVALRKPSAVLWVVQLGGRVIGPETGDSLVISGLSAQTEYPYALISVSEGGVVTRVEGVVTTSAPGAQIVLNEVLANPNGPEPAQEWIELFNAGSREASLAGYTLEDGAGSVELPAARVAPGEYALLVTPEYDRAYPFDLSPSKDVQLIVVDQLGKSGLSNAGEPLILRDTSGDLVSAIPPLKQDKAGYSVARRIPELSDVVTSFQTHGAPGASPGEANRFDLSD